MGDVIWVIAVIAFWMGLGALVVFLIRIVASSHDDEEIVCDLPEPVSVITGDGVATT